MRSIKQAGVFVWRNLDAVSVIVVGLGVAVLQASGSTSKGAVDAAILGLLAVMATILLRARERRGELDEIKEIARDALSERPFQMVWAKNEWDIQTRDRAVITSTRQLRFIHDRVSTIEHWSEGDGTVISYNAFWRRVERRSWMPAKKIHSIPIEGGENVIYCLEEQSSRGETLEWKVERETAGRFPRDHEAVSVRAAAKSDHPRQMRIAWPRDSPPSTVEMRFRGVPGRSSLLEREPAAWRWWSESPAWPSEKWSRFDGFGERNLRRTRLRWIADQEMREEEERMSSEDHTGD